MITKLQRDLMEHTISGHNRNWFGTNKTTTDAIEFDKLVEMGFASIHSAPSWAGDDVMYKLTPKGRKALK